MNWEPADELDFLRNLGHHRDSVIARSPQMSRRCLLEWYIKTAHLRVRWGSLHKTEVLEAAEKMLLEEIEK